MSRRLPAVALAALLLVAGCGSPSESATPDGSPTTSSAPTNSVTPSPSGPPTTTLEEAATWNVTVETAPDWPALLDGSLWVLTPDQRAEDDPDPGVVRLDPETGEEQARVPLSIGACEAMAAGFGSIWACTTDGLARIDPATNAIIATVSFPTPEFYGRPAVTEDAIWAAAGDVVATELVRIDPTTNTVTATYPVGHTVGRLTYGLGSVWVTATRDGLLLEVDPATGAITEAAADLVDPLVVATGAGLVWVGLQAAGTDVDPDPSVPDLFRLDPATGTSDVHDFDLRQEGIGDIAFSNDAAWMQATGPFLMELDPTTAAVRRSVSADFGTGALLTSDEALWMTLWRDNSVVRIDL